MQQISYESSVHRASGTIRTHELFKAHNNQNQSASSVLTALTLLSTHYDVQEVPVRALKGLLDGIKQCAKKTKTNCKHSLKTDVYARTKYINRKKNPCCFTLCVLITTPN